MATTTPIVKTSSKPAEGALPGERGFEAQWREPRRTLVDYAGGIWAFKLWIVLVTAAAMVAGFGVALLKPNSYLSNAVLMVYGSSAAASPAAAAANLVQVGHIGPSQVLAAVEIIHSRPVARAVVDAVGVSEVLKPYQPIRARDQRERGFTDRLIDWMHDLQVTISASRDDSASWSPEYLREAAVTRLLGSLYVSPDERASVIKLFYYAPNPDTAQKVLEATVHESTRTYSELFAPPSAKSWLEGKMADALKEARAASAALEEFKKAHGAADFHDQIDSWKQQVLALDLAVKKASLDQQKNTHVLEIARKEIQSVEPTTSRIVEEVQHNDLYLDYLRQTLFGFLLDEQRERATMGQGSTESPKLKELLDLIKTTRAEIESRSEHPLTTRTIVDNPRFVALQDTINRRDIENIDLQQTIELYPKRWQEGLEHLEKLETAQDEAKRLHERLAKAEEEVQQLGFRISTFEITQELDTKGLTSLRAVEPATFPTAKEGPARGRIVVGAFVAGLLLSITLVLARVRLGRTWFRSSEVAFSLGRSDVVGIPRIAGRNVRRFALFRRKGWD